MTKRKTFDPRSVPLAFWRSDDVQTALARHDVGTLFQAYLKMYPDCTQTQLALLTEHDRSDISNWVRGVRSGRVGDIDVLTRIADGLQMPDEARVLAGLAPASVLMSSIRTGTPAARQPSHGETPLPIADPGVTRNQMATTGGAVSCTYSVQADAAEDIQILAAKTAVLDVLAVRGLGLLGLNDSLLHDTLTATRTDELAIRVLIIAAESDAAARRAREIGESPEAFAAAARFAEHKIADLAARPGIRLEAYRYATLPVWRVISMDDSMFVSTFDEDWEGHASPVHRIDLATGGALHRGFRRMFNEIAATADRFI